MKQLFLDQRIYLKGTHMYSVSERGRKLRAKRIGDIFDFHQCGARAASLRTSNGVSQWDSKTAYSKMLPFSKQAKNNKVRFLSYLA